MGCNASGLKHLHLPQKRGQQNMAYKVTRSNKRAPCPPLGLSRQPWLEEAKPPWRDFQHLWEFPADISCIFTVNSCVFPADSCCFFPAQPCVPLSQAMNLSHQRLLYIYIISLNCNMYVIQFYNCIMWCGLFVLCQILCFAIPEFDQDYIVMLYQSRNKRHLNPSLAVLNF